MVWFYLAVKARLPDSNWLTAQSGDILTADKWNKLVPSKTILAIYDTTCPDWRKPADGTNSTPDLRWVFLRGLNTFDNGSTTNARDPDCASRTWWCAVWSYQADEFKSHKHWLILAKVIAWWGDQRRVQYGWTQYNDITTAVWWNESRGKNVAVIFCMKK